MNSDYLDQLQECCRDQDAFKQMQQILPDVCNQTALEQYRALFRVIAKIRETSDLQIIFQTTVQEVRQLLNADRVAVFRFAANGNAGEFVAEAALPEFPSVMASEQDHCFAERYARHHQQEHIQAVADSHSADLQNDYIAAYFQIRADLVVPLLQGCHLWGLLCIHQCATLREWLPEEIEFANQVAVQLAAALQQAELLAQTQQQSQALVELLDQLKRSQSQLIQIEKLSGLGQMMAEIAHEINNPVNFICGNLNHASHYAEQLIALLTLYQQEQNLPSAKLQQHLAALNLDFIVEDFPKLLASMKVGSERVRQLVLSLRSFSHTDALAMQPANLHEGIDSTLLILQHRLKPKFDSRGIQVICEYGDLPLVECYANRVNQVFMNLISNAIDALDEQSESLAETGETERPQITIRTMQIPDPQGGNPRVVICIADNGKGIPYEIQAQLFEPFFTTKPIGKGTGLGLSISRDLVVQHGGELQCYSQPGEGTEFWIELPVRQIQTAAANRMGLKLDAAQPQRSQLMSMP